MRQSPIENLISNLRGDYPEGAIGYVDKEQAYQELKQVSGKDFGPSAAAWKEWFLAEGRKQERDACKPFIKNVKDARRWVAQQRRSQGK